ncbi:MAG: PH domain-containing protein [Methanomicrobiales archaeon]
MEGREQVHGIPREQVVLELHISPAGFIARYLLALTPLFLVVISLVAAAGMHGLVSGLPMSVSTPMGSLANMREMVETLILLTAPVGIFSLAVAIGWASRYTEMWTGSLVALGLGFLGGILQLTLLDSPMSLVNLLTSISDLILPASAASVILVLAGTELFRRSIRYTITYEGIITRGGVGRRQERILPHYRIARLEMEQGIMGRLLDTGTIFPIGMVQRGTGFQREGQERSRDILDCLYRVREPGKIVEVLNLLIAESTGRTEKQVQAPGKTPWRP